MTYRRASEHDGHLQPQLTLSMDWKYFNFTYFMVIVISFKVFLHYALYTSSEKNNYCFHLKLQTTP